METKNLPVWLYHKDEGAKLFTQETTAAVARKGGWKESPADFTEAAVDMADERDDLVAEAGKLGIRVDKRWGVSRIQQAIAEHDDRA